MIKAFYTAASGSKSNQTNLDIIANNMANVSTDGYKTIKGEFSDLLYQNLNEANGLPSLMVGTGSKLTKSETVFGTGIMKQTDNDTDYAIEGDGFFGILRNDGIYFTRDGSFTVGILDGEEYLMLGTGFVLDENGDPVTLNEDGKFSNVGVYVFNNNSDLTRYGDNLYKIDNPNTQYELTDGKNAKKGFLEGSSVNLANEMVKMIQTQRAFQFNSKVIQTADEIEQTINSLKG